MLRTDLGDGVGLRPMSVDDADELHAVIVRNRDHLRPWMPWADQDLERTRQYLRDATLDPRDIQAAVTMDGRIVGAIGLVHPAGFAMVGYWLAAEAQGRGIMTRAVLAFVDHALDDLGYDRVELRAAVNNARSRAVAERAGFVLMRTIPDAAVINGRSVDHVVYERRRSSLSGGPGAPSRAAGR
jgi:ribosomal-protein-serine acetyltransferase